MLLAQAKEATELISKASEWGLIALFAMLLLLACLWLLFHLVTVVLPRTQDRAATLVERIESECREERKEFVNVIEKLCERVERIETKIDQLPARKS